MKRINLILCVLLLFIPLLLSAQTELNSFLRKAVYWQISTNGEENFEQASKMSVQQNGPNLYFWFTMIWIGLDGDANQSNYKVTIDLGRSTIYNGYWSTYGGGRYNQVGDKSIVTIKQNSINYELEHGFESKIHTGKLIRNELLIDCRTEDDAVKLVSLLTTLQKNYREPYPWSQNETNVTTGSTNISSKEIYEQLAKDFKTFLIMSRNVYYHETSSYTTGVGIMFSYPYIIITYTDKWKEGVLSSVVKPGKYTVKIPINNCDFSSTKSYAGSKASLIFTSSQGIEIYYSNKLSLEPRFELMISGLGAERICNILRQFKNAVLSEGYKGSYGITDKPRTIKDGQTQKKPKSILNKYEE